MNSRAISLALATAAFVSGCTRSLDHRMDCNRVLQLRLGQTPDAVRALLGEPRSAGKGGPIWRDGSPRSDYVFGYSRTGAVLLGTRDEMFVSFLEGRLIEVSAYRMPVYFPDHGKGTTALVLGSRDYGYRTPPFQTIGPAFKDVFQCGSDFSFDLAGTDWTFEK